MIRSKSLIFSENSSRVGKAISDSWLIGVPSCFSRRPQNGEVHEIDGGVGLQQVAPDALAGVRLAGDQQHAQVLAHALGGDDRAVVGGGQLARRRLELDLDDVLAGVRERHLRS